MAETLDDIVALLRAGKRYHESGEAFVARFPGKRTGNWQHPIRRELQAAGLDMYPPFENAWKSEKLEFFLIRAEPSPKHPKKTTSVGKGTKTQKPAIEPPAKVPAPQKQPAAKAPVPEAASAVEEAEVMAEVAETVAMMMEPAGEAASSVAVMGSQSGTASDPVYRVGQLAAANNMPVFVSPTTPWRDAVTTMMMHDFSQLPVADHLVTGKVLGAITWASLGRAFALGKPFDTVRECMAKVETVSAEASIFDVARRVSEHDFVLIADRSAKIQGIVTTADFSGQVSTLLEPFMLLGEIERHLRQRIEDKLPIEEVKKFVRASNRLVDVTGLTFGDYVALFQNDQIWSKLGWPLSRKQVVAQLDSLRGIRNEVMHFSPKGIDPKQLVALRSFAQFLRHLG